MQTNYIGHDNQYRKRRAQGLPGWETAEVVAENVAALDSLLQANKVAPPGRVLELGCGAGDLSLWLAEQGYDVCGVDIAPAAVEWAREKAKARGVQGAQFFVGDVLSLGDFANESFDLVLDGYCLHCVIGEDRQKLLASAFRVLRPGGLLLVNAMCDGPNTPGMKRNFDPVSRCQVYGDVAVRYLGRPASILHEITRAGFLVARWHVDRAEADGAGENMLRAGCLKPGRPA